MAKKPRHILGLEIHLGQEQVSTGNSERDKEFKFAWDLESQTETLAQTSLNVLQ